MRLLYALSLAAVASAAAPRPFLEIAAGLPEAVDIRFGGEMGPYGLALGPGLPVFAWSRIFRDDSITPTAWNPSLTAYAHFGSGHWRLGPEAQAMYFFGETDESAASCCASARWRVDGLFLKQSLAARRLFGAWYAQAAPGWVEGKQLSVRIAGEGNISRRRNPWEFHPAFSLSFGRRF